MALLERGTAISEADTATFVWIGKNQISIVAVATRHGTLQPCCPLLPDIARFFSFVRNDKGSLLSVETRPIKRRKVLSGEKEKEKEIQEVKTIEDYIKALRKDMDKRLGDLGIQVKDVQQKTSRTVRERPILALGVAFVAGMAVGIALSKD